MRTSIRRGLGILAAAAMLTACTAAGTSGSAEAGASLQAVVGTGKLRYNVSPEAAPGFIEVNGEWKGYCAEIAQAIAAELELEPVPVVTSWGNMALDLQAGNLDVAVCAQPTGARALVVDYTTHPIYTNYYVLIARNGIDVDQWADLGARIRVGSEVGDSTIEPVKIFAPSINVTQYQDREQAILALAAGQIDVKTETLLNALQILKARNDLDARVILPEPLIAAPSAVMVQRQADGSFLNAINTVVWRLNSSGLARAIVIRNLVESGVPFESIPAEAPL